MWARVNIEKYCWVVKKRTERREGKERELHGKPVNLGSIQN